MMTLIPLVLTLLSAHIHLILILPSALIYLVLTLPSALIHLILTLQSALVHLVFTLLIALVHLVFTLPLVLFQHPLTFPLALLTPIPLVFTLSWNLCHLLNYTTPLMTTLWNHTSLMLIALLYLLFNQLLTALLRFV